MTSRAWSHPVHAWHMPHHLRPGLWRAPRMHLSRRRVEALRKGAIVALCALLSGGLGPLLWHALRGPPSPAAATAAPRA